MALTHALSTNNYGEAHLIVATSAANGTHTTLASAMADAVSGDTIFLRDSVTENVTLTPGVNLNAWNANSKTSSVSITGKLTMTGAGTCTISNLTLVTNSDFLLAVTGSAASIVNLTNCYLNCSNNTGISFTTSSSSAAIRLWSCSGDLGTIGIALFASSSAGTLRMNWCDFTNSGGSTTAATLSAGTFNPSYVTLPSPLTTSSTGLLQAGYTTFNGTNVTALTHGGSVASSCGHCQFGSGSASAISISSTLQVLKSTVFSSNTNAITGAGTLTFEHIGFTGTSSGINTTTLTPLASQYGYLRSLKQPGFAAYLNTQDTDVTGNGATYTLGSGNALTEIFDQNSDFNTNGTFTAPITGRYYLQYCQGFGGLTAAMTSAVYRIVTSNNTWTIGNISTATAMTSTNNYVYNGSVYCDMDAGDTATYTAVIGNGAGNTADSLAPSSGNRTYVTGFMLC